jgi:membrane fusion protein, copper/silver efflux system
MRKPFARIRGVHHQRWLMLGGVFIALVAIVTAVGCTPKPSAGQHDPQHGQPAPAAEKVIYVCPMHPEVRQDKPGECPICGMDLVPMKTSAPTPAPAAKPEPSGQAPPPAPAEHQHGEAAPAPQGQPMAPTVQGLAPVHTEPDRAQLAGVRTVAAVTDSVTSTVRAVGTVVPDETRVRDVTTKVSGWVEKLHVNAVGQFVRAGQPLLDLYSPELLASQEEYLRARQNVAEFERSSLPEVRRGGEDLVRAAHRRLELFDVPAGFLGQLDESGKAQRAITFLAPFNGYVTRKAVLEGQKVEPGMALLTVADLSRVWVVGQLYEAEAAAAKSGRAATVTLPYGPDVALRGRVTLVYPEIDLDSRTIKVRFEFPNPQLALKPGMFVNIALEASRASGVVVPDSAVIDSGTRQVVFVEAAPGHFEPREVKVGLRADGRALLQTGVQAGERVAVAANFLLDSESRLRGAMTGSAAAPAETHQH